MTLLKRPASALLASAVALMLSACGGGGSSVSDATTSTTATPSATTNTSTNTSTSTTPAPVAFSTGFTATSATANNGYWGNYSGSNLDGWNCTGGASWCGGGSSGNSSLATSGAYAYYQTPASAAGQYMGVFLQYPGVPNPLSSSANSGGLLLSGQTSLSFTLNQNPEWAAQTNHNVLVILTLGKFYSVSGNACNIKLQTVFTPSGGATATAYTLPLSQFVVSQNCGIGSLTPTSVTAALSANPVAQIDFQGDGGTSAITVNSLLSSANTTVKTSGGFYPTTIALTGPVGFQ